MIDEDYVIGVNELVCENNGQQSILKEPGLLSSAIGVQQWFDTV